MANTIALPVGADKVMVGWLTRFGLNFAALPHECLYQLQDNEMMDSVLGKDVSYRYLVSSELT